MSNHYGSGRDVDNRNDVERARQPIAIVGIGCRFPGGADRPERFWSNLRAGVDAIDEVPASRWNLDRFYDPAPGIPGKTQARRGGFVESLDQFDPQFFGISPREAARMDPQQRMLLEVAWEAIEDAGLVTGQLAGSRTSVYVGISSWDFAYLGLSYRDRGVINAYSNTGGALSIASNRISYCFDLRGPSASVDTACSSALVALHLACQSIWNEGCPMALSGGVNALLTPDFYVAFSQLSMLSPDGRCKAFDARANGFVRGEGAGMVVLKPLARALSDNDRIYAVIRGTATNQDGRTPGMTVPRQESQESLLRRACENAGVSPGTIQYVEAHGTGTAVGDPIETRALGSVLSVDRPDDQPCLIGSVKTNLGHLEAGAGIASLIKVALSLHHGQIPQNLHFEQPNPDIDFAGLKLRVPVRCEPWPDYGGLRLAGINGFGYGGTNAHAILQGMDFQVTTGTADAERSCRCGRSDTDPVRPTQLFPLSARSFDALTATAKEMETFVRQSDADTDLLELAGHVAHRRSHHDYRLAVVARSKEHLADQLAQFAAESSAPDVVNARCAATPPHLAFVCSGQGPQWWAMGRELLATEPVFRQIIERCDQVSRQLGKWSLWDELCATAQSSRMNMTAIAQPSIFALQVALGELWRSWGVVPAQIVGHSVGEVAAAQLAGVYSLEEAFRIVYHRGRCMDLASSQGRMLAVGLEQAEAEQLVAPYNGQVTIAAINSPSSITLSGAAGPLAEIATLLEQRQVFCRSLQVEYAFHSPQMDPARDELLESLRDIRPARAVVPLMSTVTGQWVEGPELDADYWWRNVRHTVRFADAMRQLARTDTDTILELSPHPVLAYSITECFQQSQRPVQVLSSLKRETPELPHMLRSLGQLHTSGYPINWHEVAPKPQRFLSLPTYPWQRQTCWFESIQSHHSRFAPAVHPLLGVLQDAPQPGWHSRLDVHQSPYLADHKVQGMAIFPAAGYAEMALAAASAMRGETSCRVSKLVLANPCILTPEQPVWFDTQYHTEDRDLKIHSRPADEEGDWTLHATAECSAHAASPPPERFDWQAVRRRCPEHFDKASCYQFIAQLGLDYGPAFQGLMEGWRRGGEAIGIVELPAELAAQQDRYLVHPALLDACFHVSIPAGEDYNTSSTNLYLPVEISQLTLFDRPASRVVCHARLQQKSQTRTVVDLNVYDEDGRLLLEVRGLTSRYVSGSPSVESVDDLLYRYTWQARPLDHDAAQEATARQEMDAGVERASLETADNTTESRGAGRWLIFADRSGVGETLAARLKNDGHDVVTVTYGSGYSAGRNGHYEIAPDNRDDMLRLIRSTVADEARECAGIVHLWSLDAPRDDSLDAGLLDDAQDRGVLSALHLVQAWDAEVADRSTRLMLVTRGAQSVGARPEPVSVAQSPMIGFGRVVISEYPKFQCKLIDTDPAHDAECIDHLLAELVATDDEDEVAWRGGDRHVHRFTAWSDQQQLVPRQLEEPAYRLETPRGGTLDNLTLRTFVRTAPDAGEVEIQIAAAALNFSDVMKALGLYPGLPDGPISLGAECSGVITRVGEEVTDFSPGDEVMAVVPFAFGSHAIVRADLVAVKPAQVSLREAATIPIAFLTAVYALEQLAHLRRGERVLIHSATGGVGLAALQLARRAGAEIFATAGTPEKRELLKQLGVHYIADSRSLDFADQIRQWTDGQGVDVVLNSLAGEAIQRGIESLATGGRFVEIGKRDIYQNAQLGLLPFKDNLSFFALDLDQLMRTDPGRIGDLLRELSGRFTAGKLAPLPHTSYDIENVQDAFRFMQQGKHTGKIVVSMQKRPANLEWGACEPLYFDPESTYLVTGGFGGFGLALAEWLVARGARHLALMGRRGAHGPKGRQVLEQLEQRGATVTVLKADVTNRADVERALQQVESSGPPLRGIFHAAMVLEDGLLLNLDRDWMRRVMAPKVHGAWNLHELTRDLPLDCFVLFSSLSSVFGHAGQGNYAAANSFLDGLTYHRRAQDLPCLTVNWGYLGDVGYLAERQQLGERLERQGVMSFSIDHALEALEMVMQRRAIDMSVMRVEWSRWRGLGVTGHVSPRFAHLLPHNGLAEGGMRTGVPTLEALRSASSVERPQLVDRVLRDKVARLLGVVPEQLDGNTPLLDLGLDSLMAVEMRNWIESQLRVDLPVVQLMRSPGLARLVETVCDQVAQQEVVTQPKDEAESEKARSQISEDPRELLENIDQLSSDQVDNLLANLMQEESVERTRESDGRNAELP